MSLGPSHHLGSQRQWVLSTIAFTGLLLFAATPRARAETQEECQHHIAHIDHELHEAIQLMGFTATRPNTSGMSYTKRVNDAGANIISGGTSTSIVGTPSRTGTIATTRVTTITN
jgi:hypothetical protein